MESETPDAHPPKPSAARATTVRYLGFESTSAGRSYRLRADVAGEPRHVTVIVPGQAFAEHKLRFQDAPELCVARLQREIESGADVPDGLELRVTPDELDVYRESQGRRPSERRSRPARNGS
jgi:hypothetical protein